jgi:erythromycin esterase-like protein
MSLNLNRRVLARARLGAVLAACIALSSCGGGGGGQSPGQGEGAGGSAPPTGTPAPPPPPPSAVAAVQASARPISGGAQDYSDILAAAAPARRVLLGESTHGTAEYYRERGRITERLVMDQGAGAVTIEGDWTPTFRVNLYVRGFGSDSSAAEALQGYSARFPRWMWRNAQFAEFVERLRAINLARPVEQRTGLYGMDVYDLYDAADQVVAYLRPRDPAAANRVSDLYNCFASFGRSGETYGQAVARRVDNCRDEAEAAVAEVGRIARPADPEQAEYHFGAVRGAASVAAAEEYYRIAYAGNESSWNARDRRMEQTVEAAALHAQALSGRQGKTVSWSHNTHTGNAAATSMASAGELNLGQLMRQRHGEGALLVGFFSYSGTVFAASQWGGEGQVFTMRPAIAGSHSALFHGAGIAAFSLLLRGNAALSSALQPAMSQRAIGVVYLPESEVQSHYIQARLSDQFDAVIFFDQSGAVTPL